MRTSQVLALLAEQERKFDRERQAFREERERLLDRIMLLADKPLPLNWEPTAWEAPDPDLVDPTQMMGEDLV